MEGLADRATSAVNGSGTNVEPSGAPATSEACLRMKTTDWAWKLALVSEFTRLGAPGMNTLNRCVGLSKTEID